MNELLRIFHYLYLKCTLENKINCDRRKKRVPDMLPFGVSHTLLQNSRNYFLEGFLHSDNNQKGKIKFLDNCCFLNANMGGGRQLVAPVSRYLTKLRWGDFRISDQSLINKNVSNSRTSNDIDMKLGQVTNLTGETIVTSLLFLQFMSNLEESGSRMRGL